MRIAFVHSLSESIGIEYISAFLKREGHEISLFYDPVLFDNYLMKNKIMDSIFSYRRSLIESVIKYSPDIVAFSALWDNYIWSCEVAREIKRRVNTTIVFGGIHPTAVPHRVLRNDFIDFVIVGEGEEAMLELINCLASGKQAYGIDNLAYRCGSKITVNAPRPPIQDLDKLPFPDKDLFYSEYRNFINDNYFISSSRGCFYHCSYCNWNLVEKMYGGYYRRRSPGNVIKELVWAKNRYKIKRIEFMDSVFTHDRGWLEEFLPLYKEMIDIPFFCFIYPSPTIDSHLVNMIHGAGCGTMTMGAQTIDMELRRKVYLRKETNEHITHSIGLIKKAGIGLIVGFILFPTQTIQEVIDTLLFCYNSSPDFAVNQWVMYFPGAEIVYISKKLAVLSDEDIDDIEEGRDKFPYFKKNGSVKEISKITNLFYFSGVIPLSIMKNIVRFKLYRFMPSFNMYLPGLTIASLMRKDLRREGLISVFYYIKYYIYYITRKLICRH